MSIKYILKNTTYFLFEEDSFGSQCDRQFGDIKR